MPLLSVISASYQTPTSLLRVAWQSVQQQTLPPGWDWEWIIQCDGPGHPPLPKEIEEDSRVQVETSPRRLGAAASRNYALVRSQGTYIRCLDADDWLLDGTLRRAIVALERYQDAAFCFSPIRVYREATRQFADPGMVLPYEDGYLPAGALDVQWRNGDDLGIAAMSVCFRRVHLLAAGGWPALSRWEDVVLAIGLGAAYPTVFDSQPGTVYRRHDRQTTATREPQLRPLHALLLHQQIAARRQLAGVPSDRPLPILPPTADEVF